MKKRPFLHALNDAVNGFIYVVRYERNMRVHFLFAFLMLLLAIFLGASRTDWIILTTASTLVLVAEMMNTAIEETIDLVRTNFHPAAKIVKHISAGMVLVTVCNSVIVGFFIFSKYWRGPFESMVTSVRYAPLHITLVSILVSIFIVIAGKAFFKKGTPFRGGPISGHSAVAFSLWTVILSTQSNLFVIAVAFLLACLVAQSRIRLKIHSIVEVITGAVVGILVTALFFKLFHS